MARYHQVRKQLPRSFSAKSAFVTCTRRDTCGGNRAARLGIAARQSQLGHAIARRM